ncbi:MAG: response regulator transcription factor [Flavobacteriales bacterium]|nr:response regulator transcription factor [Flavobacteriales bacterium]
MHELKAIIIEDEEVSRETLRNYLTKYCPNVNIAAEAENISIGKTAIETHRPQLVFLDVEMPYGNGFDLLEQLPEIDFELIFVTAFSNYALKALNMSASYYLLKPIDIEELIASVEKVSQNIQNKDRIHSARILQTNLHTTENQLKRIVLPELEGFEVAQLKDIVYCKANDNLTDFMFVNGKKKTICKTLKHFDELLGDAGFFRIHKSYLINLEHVQGYKKGKGGFVEMSNGKELEIAIRRKQDFLERFVG